MALETDKYISKVRTFGAFGYDAERIADLLSLHGRTRVELIVRLSIPGDELRVAYDNGRAIGEYNIDVELTKQAERGDIDAITTLAERSKERKMKDLKKDLFGT
ncbi:MAG: hypothetical protein PHV66_00245 [Bacteroidales bacterium]|nr:hypothetical protein [Bacteroidales bacterium]